MALLYVLLDLINEVTLGTITASKKLLWRLLELCNSPLKEEDRPALGMVQEKLFHLVSRHLVKEVISPNENVRKEVGVVGVVGEWVWLVGGRGHFAYIFYACDAVCKKFHTTHCIIFTCKKYYERKKDCDSMIHIFFLCL